MPIINLTNHSATPAQVKAGVIEPDSRERVRELITFKTIPSRDEITTRARELARIARDELHGQWIYGCWDYKPDMLNCGCEACTFNITHAAMIGGAPWLMGALASELKNEGIDVFYAFSKRESVEEKQEDGSIVKKSVFRHIGFVEDFA